MHLLTLIIVYSFKALLLVFFFFFFFNDTATTEIYTLSLHDALPISLALRTAAAAMALSKTPLSATAMRALMVHNADHARSEEHTSELQSRLHLVCRLLLEKKKNKIPQYKQMQEKP